MKAIYLIALMSAATTNPIGPLEEDVQNVEQRRQ